MKLRFFIGLITTFVVLTGTVIASEIYNKDGSMLNVSGNFYGGQYVSENHTNNGSHIFLRYSLGGRTNIGSDKIACFGKWEHEFPLENVEEGINLKDNGRTLLGYVGVKFGDFGSFDYGRNYGILYDVESWTDLTPEFGGDIVALPDNFLSGRASNVITYRNSNLFGLLNGFDFAIQYQIKNDVNPSIGRTIKTANGEGYGLSVSYELWNNISASAAYANSKRIFEQMNLDNNSDSDTAEAYYLGLKYNAYGAYLSATYGETYNMIPFGNFNDILNPENIYGFINKSKNVSIIAQYRFDCGFMPSVSYLYSRASDMENSYGNCLKNCVTMGGGYTFNNQFFATVKYRLNFLNKNDFTTAARICTDNILAIGLSYLF